jgi:hypothetical protein
MGSRWMQHQGALKKRQARARRRSKVAKASRKANRP